MGYSPLGCKESDRTEILSMHCLGLPPKGRLQIRGCHLPSSRRPGSPPSEGASLALQVCAGAGYLLLRLLLSEDLHILNLLVGWGCSLLCFLILLACGVEERCGGPLHGLFPLWSLLTELWPRAEKWPPFCFLDGSRGLGCSEFLGGGSWPVRVALGGWYMSLFCLCLHFCLCH